MLPGLESKLSMLSHLEEKEHSLKSCRLLGEFKGGNWSELHWTPTFGDRVCSGSFREALASSLLCFLSPQTASVMVNAPLRDIIILS